MYLRTSLKIVGWTGLAVWLVTVSVALASLGAWHYVSLPTPSRAELASQLAARSVGASPRWEMIHILSAECGCSRRIATSLEQRHAQPDVRETIWWVGATNAQTARLQAAGFVLEAKSARQLADELKVESVPAVLIFSPTGQLQYSGGYAERNPASQNLAPELALLARVRAGETVPARPVFGCATSARLQQILDPLGLKY